jgi:hypothetical protein
MLLEHKIFEQFPTVLCEQSICSGCVIMLPALALLHAAAAVCTFPAYQGTLIHNTTQL